MLIEGKDLTARQRKLVLQAFVHRHTVESPWGAWALAAAGAGAPRASTDEEFILSHAFYFVKDGSRLAAKPNHCEPVYLAD